MKQTKSFITGTISNFKKMQYTGLNVISKMPAFFTD